MIFGIICASDRCSKGLCEDKSGPLIKELLKDLGETMSYKIVSDDFYLLSDALRIMCDEDKVDVIFTTGGTGLSPRDVTPEATRNVIEKEAPGISEAIRYESFKITPKAMLSRGVSGIRNKTLIINLPGSPKAVRESLEIVKPILVHAVEILSGKTSNCGGNY